MNKSCDIGIVFQKSENIGGYLKFCQYLEEDNTFIFLQKRKNTTNMVFLCGQTLITKKIPFHPTEISDLKKKDGHIFVLTNTELHDITENKKWDFSKYHPFTLHILYNQLAITTKKHEIVFFDTTTESINVLEIDSIFSNVLCLAERDHDHFYAVDCASHIVAIINRKGETEWIYGEIRKPGVKIGQLYVPTRVEQLSMNLLVISEQRTSRISVVNTESGNVTTIGTSSWIGDDTHRLWAPNFIKGQESWYIVMCRGSRIAIRKYNKESSCWEKSYGSMPFSYSEFNTPRAIEINTDLKMCLIADTYHDRVVVYNLCNNSKHKILDRELLCDLSWPRAAIWDNDKVIVADSKNRRIIESTIEGNVLECVQLSDRLFPNQWITSIDLYRKEGLAFLYISFETGWCVYDFLHHDMVEIDDGTEIENGYLDIHSIKYNKEAVIIADTGNNRIVIKTRKNITVFSEFERDQGTPIVLSKPRFANFWGDELWIVNSGKSEILRVSSNMKKCIARYGVERGMDENAFSLPRWCCLDGEGGVYISDTDNHRIAYRIIDNLINTINLE